MNPLYIIWNPSDTALRIGHFALHWYSLCWLAGLLLAYLIVRKLYREQKIKDELFDPLFIYCFVGIIVGARLGHCLFYQPDFFLSSWKHVVEIFVPIEFLEGGGWKFTGYRGLASHGGTLGLMLALWLYRRKTGLSLWQVLDDIAIATPVTACLIRLGNLMNSEILGRVTDLPWGFYFVQAGPEMAAQPRHPQAPAARGLGLLLRTVPDAHLHVPLLHRVHQGHTGVIRVVHAPRHGPDTLHTLRGARRVVHAPRPEGRQVTAPRPLPAASDGGTPHTVTPCFAHIGQSRA